MRVAPLDRKLGAPTPWAQRRVKLRHSPAVFPGRVGTYLALDNAIQVGLIILALFIGRLLGARLRRVIGSASEHRPWRTDVHTVVARIAVLSIPITMLVFLWVAAEAGTQTALFGNHLTRTVASLINAWVVIRLASVLIRNEVLARFIAWSAWILAALTTLGLFDATIALLDGMAMTFGEVRVSILTVVKGVLALGALLWLTVSVSNMLERRISRAGSLTPSVQVLVSKLIKIVLVSLAFLIAIGSLGIDFTALTVFGGALGIGIGFGMQKSVRVRERRRLPWHGRGAARSRHQRHGAARPIVRGCVRE